MRDPQEVRKKRTKDDLPAGMREEEKKERKDGLFFSSFLPLFPPLLRASDSIFSFRKK